MIRREAVGAMLASVAGAAVVAPSATTVVTVDLIRVDVRSANTGAVYTSDAARRLVELLPGTSVRGDSTDDASPVVGRVVAARLDADGFVVADVLLSSTVAADVRSGLKAVIPDMEALGCNTPDGVVVEGMTRVCLAVSHFPKPSWSR